MPPSSKSPPALFWRKRTFGDLARPETFLAATFFCKRREKSFARDFPSHLPPLKFSNCFPSSSSPYLAMLLSQEQIFIMSQPRTSWDFEAAHFPSISESHSGKKGKEKLSPMMAKKYTQWGGKLLPSFVPVCLSLGLSLCLWRRRTRRKLAECH